jgi:hypothetical protein
MNGAITLDNFAMEKRNVGVCRRLSRRANFDLDGVGVQVGGVLVRTTPKT